MDFEELIHRRYSVRAYQPQEISEELLNKVLEAARMAPSACNRQPFQFLVVHTAGREAALKKIYPREWFTQAPVILCACGVPDQAWVHSSGKSYLDVDVAIAVDHLTLAAADLGLGTCWIAEFDFDAARQEFGLPADIVPLVLVTLGVPAGQPKPKRRKPLSDLVRYERW